MDAKGQPGHRLQFAIVTTVTITLFLFITLFVVLVAAQQPAAEPLTGNWVVRTPNADGTFRTTYLNLKQEGPRITGSIRVTQFFYLITESSGGPEAFTITAALKDGSYQYINIDDTWEAGRDANGNIQTNKKFPDMKALADYVHRKGLKLGIYSSPGPNTCAGYEGSYGHEEQDARTYAAWGIDYLIYDRCGASTLYTDEEMPAIYQKMGEALRKSGRPIVYSLCQYGRLDVWKWGADVGGNLWRTTGDIRDTWDSMTRIGFGQNELAQWARPGHWNDPDMLEIGNGGMSETEYKTHMSLWAILAAPMLAGNDLRNMSPAILAILTNREVSGVNQDKEGKQGSRISKTGDQETWARPLAGGARAVAIFNRATEPATLTIPWVDLGITGKAQVRDLWEHKAIEVQGPTFSVTVPGHGVVMLRVNR